MSLLPTFLQSLEVPLWIALLCLAVAAAFIGIGKAGFGGGVGLVSPALFAQVMPMREVLGLMQPLLMVCDAVAIKAWWGKWDLRNLWLLLPGTALGVLSGSAVLAHVSDRVLQIALGVLSLAFIALQLARQRGLVTGSAFRPVWWQGALVGAAAGVCSTLAHAAGPIITLYLLP
jgi:uncharacterized membrane protein YfcA